MRSASITAGLAVTLFVLNVGPCEAQEACANAVAARAVHEALQHHLVALDGANMSAVVSVRYDSTFLRVYGDRLLMRLRSPRSSVVALDAPAFREYAARIGAVGLLGSDRIVIHIGMGQIVDDTVHIIVSDAFGDTDTLEVAIAVISPFQPFLNRGGTWLWRFVVGPLCDIREARRTTLGMS